MPTPSEAPCGERVETRREGRKARQSPDHEPETGGESRGGTHNPLVAGSSPARPTTLTSPDLQICYDNMDGTVAVAPSRYTTVRPASSNVDAWRGACGQRCCAGVAARRIVPVPLVYESGLLAVCGYPPQAASWQPDEQDDAGLGSSAITVSGYDPRRPDLDLTAPKRPSAGTGSRPEAVGSTSHPIAVIDRLFARQAGSREE
jgi:hypothetical protein